MGLKHQVFLSLGSNIKRHENISQCLIRLGQRFGEVVSSPVYESEPVGFNGDCFYNLVVKIETSNSLRVLSEFLKDIEHDQGRERSGKRFSSRTLDIDILLFDEQTGVMDGIELPRPEVYYNAFVLLPLAELAPTLKDPKSDLSFSQLWHEKSASILDKQKLWKVDFDWPECVRPVNLNIE